MSDSRPIAWETLSSHILLDRPPWIRVREDRVRLPTGAVLEQFYVLEYADWACVVPVTERGEVVMVEQWRHAINRVSLEFPAGAVDPGEDPEAAARRELAEETGAVAGRLVHLATVATEPSRHTNMAHLYLARDARVAQTARPDVSEDLVTRTVSLDSLAHRIATGEIVHGVHVAAALLALNAIEAV